MRPALFAVPLALIAASATAEPRVTTFTLDNGMEGVVIEDNRAPVVTHMVWYRVGAADEPPGQSGIAHFLEHLMFKGTDTIPEGGFSRVVAENGGQDNAFTSRDFTGYFQRIAADRLAIVMEMEADRMRNLRVTERQALTERDVILEERSQVVDNNPGAQFSELMSAALFKHHPYRMPVIGWRAEMETLTREMALDFYERFYAPDNAILVVAGDVDPAEVQELAEMFFGHHEPSGRPREARVQEPPHRAARRIEMRDARVAQPYMLRQYLVPSRVSGDAETAAALTILAEVLGGSGVTSRMGRALQVEQEIAIAVAAFYSGLAVDDTSFGVYAMPADGVAPEALEAAVDAVMAALAAEGPTEAELARARTGVQASEVFAQDSGPGLARRFGAALSVGLTVQDVLDWPDLLKAVTAEDVKAAAALLRTEASVTGWLKPAADTARAEPIREGVEG
ncbi:MAG: insulinase family protein [Rhodobacteraceae bacterium]|nr:MAG: insulinase family protein [Paracoccaceae bacterium]